MGHAAQAVSHSRQPRLSYAHQWIRQDKHLHGSRAVNVYLTNNKIPFSSARLEKKHSVVRNCHSWKSNLALVLVKRSEIQDALRPFVVYGNELTCAEKKLIPRIASSGKDTFLRKIYVLIQFHIRRFFSCRDLQFTRLIASTLRLMYLKQARIFCVNFENLQISPSLSVKDVYYL